MNHQSTILLVDDDPLLLEALERVLWNQPYRLLTATSGQHALEILEGTVVDVVVSDEQMPGMSGSEFLAEVCNEYPETVRITLTGRASVEAAIRAINQGEIYRFLCKPVGRDALIETLEGAIELKRLRRQGADANAAASLKRKALTGLEKQHPGITNVVRDESGAICIDDLLVLADFEFQS